jgi:hypothetical protein
MRRSIFGLFFVFAASSAAMAANYECGYIPELSCSVGTSNCSVDAVIGNSRATGHSTKISIEKHVSLATLSRSGHVEQTFDHDTPPVAYARELYKRENVVERVVRDTGERYTESTRDLYWVERKHPVEFGYSGWVDGKNIFVVWNRFSSGVDALEQYWLCEETL